jgi:hypothetical protein
MDSWPKVTEPPTRDCVQLVELVDFLEPTAAEALAAVPSVAATSARDAMITPTRFTRTTPLVGTARPRRCQSVCIMSPRFVNAHS